MNSLLSHILIKNTNTRRSEIRKLMKQKGMTIEQMALKLGVNQQQILKDLEIIG